ncbi:adhesion G-protein coupled receptor F3 [Pleuronectes platessa]|uniref:adhesion G-protein coupled receptor F3 n=1 Tax=Pleuronectes platessa TaxID=8262 RepID=UPI00232A4715|nr:adhesion G-protein coupled receptor F3 [Pleuronectes platessa]
MNKMWGFIFLYILGLNISQATGEDPSTQMYYVKLRIDKNNIERLNNWLPSSLSNPTWKVDEFHPTTTCKDMAGKRQCHCEADHRWTDKVRQSNSKGCAGNTCTFPEKSHTCVSNSTVRLRGSIRIQGPGYHDCLRDENSQEYQSCHTKLLNKIQEVYSTLKGFDFLNITKYSFGSIVADFGVTISKSMSPQDLIQKSENLITALNASLNLETKGVVSLTMPDNPVKYDSQQQLLCTSKEDLGTTAVWRQKKDNKKEYPITNGTEADITFSTRSSTLTLKKISATWEGEYTCVFLQKKTSLDITHSARAVMDVALLPNIFITAVPEFPRCLNIDDVLNVRSKCLIREDNENYTVTWAGPTMEGKITPLKADYSPEEAVHQAEAAVTCHPSDPNLKPEITCTFHNRLNQSRKVSFVFNIIYVGDGFCEAEGDWRETKANFTSVLQCKNADGLRQRKCSIECIWEPEEENCVNNDVSRLLHSAHDVDIGLGSLNENAAYVFDRLRYVTNNSMAINTVSNVKATVEVLDVLSDKQGLRLNGSGVYGFLESSSNLMEKSLEKTWIEKKDYANVSMAETYIHSVEKLMKVSNITANNIQKNIELATCDKKQGSGCTNTAFGVTVDFDSSDNDSVATAGFKELQKYLPQSDEEYEVNSIVVMTTTQKNHSGSVVVKMNFPLIRPRPRNVKIKCVSWDYEKHQWSSRGCEWMGPDDDGHCVCSHLSSFAILMARYPIVLPGMSELTIIGLSISVMSLVITLVIEVIVWRAVVKSSTRYLRHVAQVNISLCLLVADLSFLASFKPENISEIWCKALVMLKHFCYLSMFFWMFCLSSTLLHQAVFLFHKMSKKVYLRFYIILGYACPLLIVLITFIASSGGAEGVYFTKESCWLVYSGFFSGSIYTFIIPVGTIVLVNVISMGVVIMKLLGQPTNAGIPDDRSAAKSVMRTVTLLTPIFGVTWIFGFGVTILDLSSGIAAPVANYAFILLNSFQGLFILLTTYLGDNLTRQALLNHLKKRASVSDSSTTLDSKLSK